MESDMKHSVDIRKLLEGWPYDPDDNVRFVTGDDGRDILQVRTPVGLEQYELDGRPDGQRPHGFESELDYQLHRCAEAESKGGLGEFRIDEDDCEALFAEGTLYYYRYLNCFQAKDWHRTLRDTQRNLRLFDFVREYAVREEDRGFLEQWRPYIMRMNTMAAIMLDLEQGQHERAIQRLNRAIEQMENLPDSEDETYQYERDRSLDALRELQQQIEKHKPLSELELLEQKLSDAIEAQAFELAAELRDRIRALRKQA